MEKESLQEWVDENPEERGYLLDEWDTEKNVITPAEITAFNRNKVMWICPKGHSYDMAVYYRTAKKAKCPYCRGLRVLKGFNDLESQAPELMNEWDYERNAANGIYPDQIHYGSDKFAWWICRKCGHKFEQRIENRTKLHQGCPDCAGLVHHSLVGQKFGKLTVIKELDEYKNDGKSKRRMVLCKCECGNERKATEKQLKSGNIRSCGCLLRRPHELDDRKFRVYQIRCRINNKIYIGKTCQTLEERCRKGNGYKNYRYTPLYNDIQLYGWENFDAFVMEEDLSKKDAADTEKKYIKELDTMNPEKGYNQNEGGDSSRGYKHDEEMLEYLRGRKVSDETREKLSKIAKERNKKYDYTEAHRKSAQTTKERGSLKGDKNGMARVVEQYDKDWNYIATYPCMMDAAAAIGAKNVTTCAANIGAACSKIKKGTNPNAFCHGYHWKYRD